MYGRKHFNEKIRQIGFLLILAFGACLIILELRYFASALLGGFTIFMVLRRPHRYLRSKGWSNGLTTAFLMIVAFVFLVLAVSGLIFIFYGKLKSFHSQFIIDGLHHIHDIVVQRWGYDIFSQEIIQKALSSAGNILPGLISATGGVAANAIMLMFVLFFLLQQRVPFERGIEKVLPLSATSVRLLKRSVHSMILTNAVGIPLIMFGQAVLAGLAYWALDAGDPVIWGLMTGFFGLIPVVGTAGIWAPLSIELLVGGHVWQGIVLAIYGFCVVSGVDSGVRIIFLKKKANVHPLITLFGVILGMNLFGFWGIIFGPLALSGFFLLIRIYNREFNAKKTNDALGEA
ncbi:MAG: AI-2E family transporter [Dysgonamonadaceae bacterium]|jgi:predicted PurR-regulated permease PerM|nr:AI-2E family transporter [Dysgonamonadaceae bacterium]